MPDDPEIPDFRIPLDDLTGEHKYALAPDEESDTPPEPGAPVAYVADVVREQPNTMTVEGAIVGIGNVAAGAAREGGSSAWTMRLVAAMFVIPALVYTVGRVSDLF